MCSLQTHTHTHAPTHNTTQSLQCTDLNEDQVKDLLSSFGDLKALHLVIDPLSGVSKVGRSDDVGADICGGQAVPCSLALVERGLEARPSLAVWKMKPLTSHPPLRSIYVGRDLHSASTSMQPLLTLLSKALMGTHAGSASHGIRAAWFTWLLPEHPLPCPPTIITITSDDTARTSYACLLVCIRPAQRIPCINPTPHPRIKYPPPTLFHPHIYPLLSPTYPPPTSLL